VTPNRPWWLLAAGRIHTMWWIALGSAMLRIDNVNEKHYAGVTS